MNAANILVITKNVIEKHNGAVPQDWERPLKNYVMLDQK